MVARAKKQLLSESEAAADLFAIAMPASDEDDSYRTRKAKGRCKERERSLAKKMRAITTATNMSMEADDKEQEAPSNVQEDNASVVPTKRERSCHGRPKKEGGQEKKSNKGGRASSKQPSTDVPGHPGGAWDSLPATNPVDFIAAMKAQGQKLVETREQEAIEEQIAKEQETNRLLVEERRREIKAREEQLRMAQREERELEALLAESARAVAAVKANTTGDVNKPRSRTSSTGEQTKTVVFADLVNAEPAKDAAESPFDDLYGWVVL